MEESPLPEDVTPGSGVRVRVLTEADLDAIVRIDAESMGRARRGFYEERVAAAVRDSRLRTSLVAELDGMVVGFLMATLHYGEFGRPEPAAVVDALGVLPAYRRRRVGEALMRSFLDNARALGVKTVRTEVAWNDFSLLHFFDQHGFAPSDRIVLERNLRRS